MQSLILVLAAATTLAAAACRDPDIRTEPLGAGAYRLTVTAKGVSDPEAARRLLARTALKLCGREAAHFGRFSFDAEEKLDAPDAASFVLRQELRCGGPDEAEPAFSTAAPRDEALIRSLSDRYFRALDEGRDDEAYALTHPIMHGGLSTQAWTAEVRAQRAESGKPGPRRIDKVTWYEDPPGAPPGLYAAVDFTAGYEKADVCGHIVWAAQPEGGFRVTREERNVIPKAEAAKMPPGEIAKIKATYGCAD